MHFLNLRFIPAPAGNRVVPFIPAPGSRYRRRIHFPGSSPRLRGTDWLSTRRLHCVRHIPDAVHPRACGEQLNSSPRLRGNELLGISGSSPRLRGTGASGRPDEGTPVSNMLRFIPAPAGNSRWLGSSSEAQPSSVHPRACGEQMKIARHRFIPAPAGNSSYWQPSFAQTDFRLSIRFIPAPAGNRRVTMRGGLDRIPVHPRACGEQTNHYVIDTG